MYKSNKLQLSSKLAATMLMAYAGLASAAPIDLAGVQYVQFGDGQSYSLAKAVETNCGGQTSGCQYYVQSTPGAIQDLIVVATGANGTGVTTNVAGMDNAYATPNGANGANFFSTNSSVNPGPTVNGTVANNNPNTWDASLSALKTYLSGDNLVFFFNNNQIKSGAGSLESLAAWAQVSITNPTGSVIGVYDFTNNLGKYALFTEGGGGTYLGNVTNYTSPGISNPVAGDNTRTDYVLSGGKICYLSNGAPASCSTPGAGSAIDNNLGANNAAYAVLFPELDAQLNSLFSSASNLANYTLHVDFRIGCDPATPVALCTAAPYGRELNNGYEQLFIGSAAAGAVVPEPASLAVFGLGLAALGVMQMRRRVK